MSSVKHRAMSPEEMRRFSAMQIAEIEKHKYYLGIELGYDPLLDRTMNDIARDWILKHGEGFRAYWNSCCCNQNMENSTGNGSPLPNAA